MKRWIFWTVMFLSVSAMAAPNALTLDHTPVLYATPYEDLVIKATPSRADLISDMLLFYRTAGKHLYDSAVMSRSASGEYTGVIPASAISRKGVVYFIAAHDRAGNEVMLFAGPERPHGVACHSVVLLKSASSSLYDEVMQGIRREAGTEIKEFDVSAGAGMDKRILERLEREPPEIIVTLGSRAAQLVRGSKISREVPVIYSMVADPRGSALKTERSTGVSFDISVQHSLSTFKTIIPNVRNVGIIFDPAKTLPLVQEARALAPSMGFEILTTRIEESGEVGPTLRAFEKGIDALWLVPDSTVVSNHNYAAILEFTRQNRIPLFVFSQDLVKRGALAALSPDYSGLGVQTGRLVRRILDGADPSSLPVGSPDKLNVALNMKTARDLKLEGLAQRIVDYAADHDYALRVYK